MTRICAPLPATQLGENLLHLPEHVTKYCGLLAPQPVRSKAETEPQGIVKGILLASSEAVVKETIFILIIFVLIVRHIVKEGVPKRQFSVFQFLNCYFNRRGQTQSYYTRV